MKKIKNALYELIKKVIENELKVDVVYNFNGSKIRTNVNSIPRSGDYVNLFYCGTYQFLQVTQVVFEMHGGVANIYLERG